MSDKVWKGKKPWANDLLNEMKIESLGGMPAASVKHLQEASKAEFYQALTMQAKG